MSSPLVSVIIPSYRAGRYIGETLAAVRAQAHRNWEILLCEDGVLDDTAQQAAAFAATTPNPVRLFQNPANLGVSRTRNRLIDEAAGEYLAFVDADDLWPPEYLEKSLERIAAAQADWQIGGADLIDENGRALNNRIIPPVVPAAAIPTELLKHSFILPSAVVAHRRVFAQGLRFDSSFPIGEDLDLWIRVIRAGFKPLIVPEPLIRYRKHPTSATANAVRFPEEFSRVLERYLGDAIVDQRLCRANVNTMLMSVARMTWRQDPPRALKALHRLFRVSPWHVRAWPFFIMAKAAQLTSS